MAVQYVNMYKEKKAEGIIFLSEYTIGSSCGGRIGHTVHDCCSMIFMVFV